VLVSGNHKLIDLWKFRKALELTKERRPDLFKKFLEQDRKFTKEEAKIVEEIRKLEP
jgi:tRNA (guanine37-N1)-methyltransferase